MTPLPFGMNSSGHSTYQEPLSLKYQISDCVRRIGIVDGGKKFQLSQLRHLNTWLIDDIKALLRRKLFSKLEAVGFLQFRLAIVNPAPSGSSFQVLFRSFNQHCGYFYIRDINNRGQFLTWFGSSNSSTALLRVLGTTLHDFIHSARFTYFTVYDISSDPSILKNVLYRASWLWHNENEKYYLPITKCSAENKLNLQSSFDDYSSLISILRTKHHKVRNQ